MVRDRTSSEFGVDGRYSFDIAGFMWMSLGSNLLFLYYDKPTSSGSTMLQLGMLLNLTADLSTTVLRQGGLYDIIAHAGTAFSLLDSTNSGYDTAGTWNTNNRSMALSGFRLGLTGHFYVVDTVRLTASAFLYTLMSSGYQRFTNTNRDTAASMFILNFGAEFRM